MVVYPDLAVLIGMLIHFAVFRLTLISLDLRRTVFECLVWSFFSGLLSGLFILPVVPYTVILILGFVICLISLRGKTAFGTLRNVWRGVILLMIYIGCLFCISGLFFGMSCLFFRNAGYFYLSFFRTVISIILSFFILHIFLLKRKKNQYKQCCDCVLKIEGKEILFRSFVDTGNFLTDPVSGLPVVLLEFSLFQKHLDKTFPLPMTYEFAARFSHRARVIPYRSVSGEGQMLSAFVPESFIVNGIVQNVVVAVTDRPVESRGQYSGIISPDLIGGE